MEKGQKTSINQTMASISKYGFMLEVSVWRDLVFFCLAPRNVKAQAYYSRINHAMRHPEDLDVLEAHFMPKFGGTLGNPDFALEEAVSLI